MHTYPIFQQILFFIIWKTSHGLSKHNRARCSSNSWWNAFQRSARETQPSCCLRRKPTFCTCPGTLQSSYFYCIQSMALCIISNATRPVLLSGIKIKRSFSEFRGGGGHLALCSETIACFMPSCCTAPEPSKEALHWPSSPSPFSAMASREIHSAYCIPKSWASVILLHRTDSAHA